MFSSDKPITCAENGADVLERQGYAQRLARALVNWTNTDTFTVGLFGKWGSGKTSLINLMLKEIEANPSNAEGNRTIVVRFEPWNFSDSDQLLSQFFIHLSNQLNNESDVPKGIGKFLQEYSQMFDIAQLFPVVGNVIAPILKTGAKQVGKWLENDFAGKDIQKQKETIIQGFNKLQCRILIVIDDIDRLSNEQIRQVFQLAKSVADFPNTTYFLAFDREIVVKALAEVQKGSGEDYLEKIIQMPIQIPDVPEAKLIDVLINRIQEILDRDEKILFSEAIWQDLFEPCIARFIKNLRDVKRLYNVVLLKMVDLASEVEFADMVAISALQIHFPSAYDWVKRNNVVLIEGLDIDAVDLNERAGNHSRKDNKDQLERYGRYQKQFMLLLNHEETDDRKEKDATIIIDFLARLFPKFGKLIGKSYGNYDRNQLRKDNRIAHPDKFDRYFHLDIDLIDIKKADVDAAAQTWNGEQLEEFLLKSDGKKASRELLEEIKTILSDISSERVKVIIEVLFKVSNQLEATSGLGLRSSRRYAEDMIIDLIGKISSVDRREFISALLRDATFNSLSTFANVINMIELSFGRLAASGIKYDYPETITLEELLEIEKVFCKKVKKIVAQHNMFDVSDWERVCYLFEYFEPDYIKEHIEDKLKENSNILKYLDASISKYRNSNSARYEISNQYEKYTTKECIITAIESQRKTGKLFELPEKVQYNAGAFFIHENDKSDRFIAQSAVQELLSSWRKGAQAGV